MSQFPGQDQYGQYPDDWDYSLPWDQQPGSGGGKPTPGGGGFERTGPQPPDNGIPYNPGSPGSATERINSRNPNRDLSRPYVDTGDTGGSLNGRTTIGEGRSITPEQAAQQTAAARAAGIDQGWINEFLRMNPGDTNRLEEAYFSDADQEDTRLGTPNNSSGWNFGGGVVGNSSGSSNGGDLNWIMNQLKSMGTNDQMNQGRMQGRMDNVRDTLNTQKKSALATNQAALASRGLIGSGPEMTARNSLDSRANDSFNQAYNSIFADESDNADSRQMAALGLASGHSLGEGGLALGSQNSANSYNLGLGNLGLQRDLGLAGLDNQQMQLILQWLGLQNDTSGGYVE
jgi:hypothetical protein